MRKTLVKLGEKELKGEYLFDGTMLFATRKLDGTVLNVKDPSSGKIFQISIREVGEVQPQDFAYIQLLNILVRKMMEKMQLAQVDRHYFDPKAAVNLKEYRLELWVSTDFFVVSKRLVNFEVSFWVVQIDEKGLVCKDFCSK